MPHLAVPLIALKHAILDHKLRRALAAERIDTAAVGALFDAVAGKAAVGELNIARTTLGNRAVDRLREVEAIEGDRITGEYRHLYKVVLLGAVNRRHRARGALRRTRLGSGETAVNFNI